MNDKNERDDTSKRNKTAFKIWDEKMRQKKDSYENGKAWNEEFKMNLWHEKLTLLLSQTCR